MIELNPTFYIALAIALILIVVYFVYKVRIKFMVTRLLAGKESVAYFKLIDKYMPDKPYPDALKDDPVYYLQTKLRNSKIPVFKTSEAAGFIDYEVGRVYVSFLKKNPSPNYLTFNSQGRGLPMIIVTGYKKDVYELEAVLNFFLSDYMFFAGEYRFKREYQKVDRVELIEKLKDRYKIDDSKILDLEEFVIEADNGYKIFFKDTGFSIDITFIQPQNKMFRNIVEQHPGTSLNSDQISENKSESITF